ncbi:STAS domain-containing protein [Desulfoluna sp.]|uniref:STAS domain-containing protein n=1 Tax=Desulfoluna sp. TaxID=2045199 RepID=UPI0026091EF3|nr:STAS domain-containing protein [Desulfoluna sp.]
MRLETKKEGGVFIIRSLESRMDAKVAVDFRAEIARHIDDGNKHIVFNVGGINFIDSSGLGAIVSCLKHVGREGELVIAEADETVLSMFKLTRMDRVFRIYETEREAIQAMST